ncbi:MAG: Plasmid stabilization system protein ParE [Sporolactobacillus laevolacticus]|jgi:plasmid stabilization system protein ParE|nr:Plasmid stabilization system protein ParE [Sporolactobacillus laevolacticus]
MKFELRFTPEAEDTYTSVIEQLFNKWGEKYVFKLQNRLEKVLNTLTENPELYPIVVETTEIRKCLLHKNCSLLYKIMGEQVVVLCFWDNRQEPIF